MSPRTRPLRVAGLFRLGLYEIDNQFGLVSLEVAQRMLNKSQPEMIQLAIDDINAAPRSLQHPADSRRPVTLRRIGRR